MHCNYSQPNQIQKCASSTNFNKIALKKMNYVIFLYLRHISVFVCVVFAAHFCSWNSCFFICLSCEHLQSLCCKIDDVFLICRCFFLFACVLSFAARWTPSATVHNLVIKWIYHCISYLVFRSMVHHIGSTTMEVIQSKVQRCTFWKGTAQMTSIILLFLMVYSHQESPLVHLRSSSPLDHFVQIWTKYNVD